MNNNTVIDDDPVDVYAYDRLWRVRTVTRATPSGSSTEATWTWYVREMWYYHDTESGQEMMTGPNSTDAPIMRLIDRNGDGDFTDTTDVEQHFVNDHQGSTVLVTGKATLDPANGNLISRGPIIAHVKYDQYGVPKFVHPADVNSDGVVDGLDTQHWLNAWREYRTHNTTSNPPSEIWKGTVDSNESGVVDESTDGADPTQPSALNTDWVAFQAQYAAATAQGAIPLDQQLGNLPLYAGYWWDDAIGLYHVRHRVYRPEWGRWLQRDPLGYAPGWNLYQYVNGMPWASVDPMGLDGHFMGDVWRSIGLNWMGEFSDDVDDGAIEVWERVTGDPYAEHAKWQMQMANMASVNSARAARAGNDRLAQSIGMSFSLEMHNATMTEDFLTDGSFAAVDMITAAVPTGWAGSRVAGWVGKTAAGTAVNAVGTKIFRIAGYVTDPIKGAIARIGKYMTDAVNNLARKVVQQISSVASRSGRQYVNLASDKRTIHILYGDGPGSGGHLWPGQPGKSAFPQSWSGQKIMHEISDIVTDPNVTFARPDGLTSPYFKSGKPARFVGHGVRDGVRIRVVCEPAGEGIITGFPDP